MAKAKILAHDIEASNLSADFGIVLTFGYGLVGKDKITVLNILDYGKDPIKAEGRMLKDVYKICMDADIWLTHYGSKGRYDLNFLNTRMLYHRLPVLPPDHPQIDTWRISRDNLRLRNNRLNTITEFLGTASRKTPIQPEEWIRALSGHRKSMKVIITHNYHDILTLKETYAIFRPLITNHPNVALIEERAGIRCRVCGGDHIQFRGWHISKQRRYRQYQCRNVTCGTWGHLSVATPL